MSVAPVSEERLHAYVDEQLAAEERSAVERHLAEHPEDAERVLAYRRQREWIKQAFDPVLAEPVPARIRVPRAGMSGSPWRRVAAVCAWIVFGAALGWLIRDQQHAVVPAAASDTELVRRARMAHVVYTAESRRAVEVAASQEQDMIRWLSKRMNAAVRVPDLSQFGFEALGGRLLPGADGPACQIMYQNAAGKRLTIYLAREPGGARPVRFSDRETVHVVFWSNGTLAFAVSAELNRDELARIAAEVAISSPAPS
ncbi:MAG: anti-sigma factor [Burkholderiales bacterium]|nr:anti-sigma factor [Burkholderiales bacterium]